MSEYSLEMEGIIKSFPGVQALKGVDLRVRPGTAHALMGENGAGKSTMMKCLLGIYQMDTGTVKLNGQPIHIKNPADSLRHGISMIPQELNPIPLRSVSDNIWVGREYRKGIGLDKKRMVKESRELLDGLHLQIDVNQMMGNLSVAQMQMVEIAKALSYNADIIIMDEPTSALTENEVAFLFQIIKKVKAQGKSVIYISHKVDEVFKICDEITVFRDGENVGHDLVENMSSDRLIRMMVGRELSSTFPKIDCEIGDIVLKVKNLSSGKAFHDVSFELHRGEILGFAGLIGAGRTELCEAIFGIRPITEGEIEIKNEKVKIHSAEDAIRHGIGMVTEDRRGSGIIPVSSVLDNISIANLKKYENRIRRLNHRKIKKDAKFYGDKLRIKMTGYDTPIKNLSGGNQQKVIVARWLLTDPDILIVDEPTRGIDVGAKAEIHQIITDLANEGKAIILISSEMPEIIGMSDRILIMHEGMLTGSLNRQDFSQERIMAYAAGQDVSI